MEKSLKKCQVCCNNLQVAWHNNTTKKCLRCEKSEIFGLSDLLEFENIEILNFAIESSKQTLKTYKEVDNELYDEVMLLEEGLKSYEPLIDYDDYENFKRDCNRIEFLKNYSMSLYPYNENDIMKDEHKIENFIQKSEVPFP